MVFTPAAPGLRTGMQVIWARFSRQYDAPFRKFCLSTSQRAGHRLRRNRRWILRISTNLFPCRRTLMETVTERWVFDSSMEVLSGVVTTGNAISAGDILMHGQCAHCGQHYCSSGSIVVEEGAVIEGSIIARNHLEIRSGCRIAGPVIAERDLIICSGCRIGTRKHPTTVSADRNF